MTVKINIDQALIKARRLQKIREIQQAQALYQEIMTSLVANSNLGTNPSTEALKQIFREHTDFLEYYIQHNPAENEFRIIYIDNLIKNKQFWKAFSEVIEGEKQGLSRERTDLLKTKICEEAIRVYISNILHQKNAKLSKIKKNIQERKLKKGKTHNILQRDLQPPILPELEDSLKLLVNFYHIGNFRQAEEHALLNIKTYPNQAILWKVLGAVFGQTGRSDRGLISFIMGHNLNPLDAELHCNISMIIKNMGFLREAEIASKEAIRLNPLYANAYNNLGNILRMLNRIDEAEEQYRKAISLEPNLADAYNNLGNIYFDKSQFLDAEECYIKALEKAPCFAEALNNLGVIYLNLKNISKAEETFRAAIELKSDYADALNNLGNVLRAQDFLAEAEKTYRESIKANQNFFVAHSNLGHILFEMGRLAEAQIECQIAIDINPMDAASNNNLGNVLRELGQISEAEILYKKAITLNPNAPEAYNNLGTIAVRKGELNLGEHYYNEALKIEENFTDAIFNRADLYMFSNRDLLAYQEYKKLLTYEKDSNSYKAAIRLAINSFIDRDTKEFKNYLKLAQPIQEKRGKSLDPEKIYLTYLKSLDAYNNSIVSEPAYKNQISKKLFVVGDSHSLALVNQVVNLGDEEYLCVPKWIMGCKQWHCSSSKISKYKNKFEYTVANIQQGSVVLFLLGEIDCRWDEGIFEFYRKNQNKTLSEIITDTITGYLSTINRLILNKNLEVIISSVPEPNWEFYRSQLSQDQLSNFSDFIQNYNHLLRIHVLKYNYGYLDLYEMTKKVTSGKKSSWHLDSHHLVPQAYNEAFNRFYYAQKP